MLERKRSTRALSAVEDMVMPLRATESNFPSTLMAAFTKTLGLFMN
jgi:hypothetical protein